MITNWAISLRRILLRTAVLAAVLVYGVAWIGGLMLLLGLV